MVSQRSQQGLSLIGWLVVLIVLAFLGIAVIRLFPHYFDNMTLERAISAADSDQTVSLKDTRDVYRYIGRVIEANRLDGIDPDKVATVTSDHSEFLIHIAYEKREPWVGNIGLVVSFNKELRIRKQ